MEKRLWKSSLYGFLFGLAISILFVSYKDIAEVTDGVYQTTYKPVFDYIISILRIGIIGMFLGLFIGWKAYEKKYKKQTGKSYYLLTFFVVFLVSSILMLIFNW
jgi:MFS superfamily sulfate permease-like transporter